jgi:hypothetical protein
MPAADDRAHAPGPNLQPTHIIAVYMSTPGGGQIRRESGKGSSLEGPCGSCVWRTGLSLCPCRESEVVAVFGQSCLLHL